MKDGSALYACAKSCLKCLTDYRKLESTDLRMYINPVSFDEMNILSIVYGPGVVFSITLTLDGCTALELVVVFSITE